MDLITRDATPADWPAVVAIYNQSIPAGTATADTVPLAGPESVPWLADVDPARRPLWVGVVAGEVVGWCRLKSFYAGRPAYAATAEVSLYVATAWHRRGVGEALKRHAIAQCPRLGVTTLVSFHFDHNRATADLNAKLGFTPAGHLERIAVVNGREHGLVISLLRVTPDATAGPDPAPHEDAP